MSTKILAGSNVFDVELKTYEVVGDKSLEDEYAMVFYASLVKNGPEIEIKFPKPPDKIVSTINELGIAALTNSIIDFNKRSVTLKRNSNENAPSAPASIRNSTPQPGGALIG